MALHLFLGACASMHVLYHTWILVALSVFSLSVIIGLTVHGCTYVDFEFMTALHVCAHKFW